MLCNFVLMWAKKWLSVSWLPYLLSGCHTCPGCTFWRYIHYERSWQPLCLHITSKALRKVTSLLLLNCILISGLASLRGKFVPQNPRWVFFKAGTARKLKGASSIHYAYKGDQGGRSWQPFGEGKNFVSIRDGWMDEFSEKFQRREEGSFSIQKFMLQILDLYTGFF